jgi:hypothetical protein
MVNICVIGKAIVCSICILTSEAPPARLTLVAQYSACVMYEVSDERSWTASAYEQVLRQLLQH